jgi:hypothetical protein
MYRSRRKKLASARKFVEGVVFFAAVFVLLAQGFWGSGWGVGMMHAAYILLGGQAFGGITDLLSKSLFIGRAVHGLYPGIIRAAVMSTFPGALLVTDHYHGNAGWWFAGWSVFGALLYCALWLEVCNRFDSTITGLTTAQNSKDLRFARWATIVCAAVYLGLGNLIDFSRIAAIAVAVMTVAVAIIVLKVEGDIRTRARRNHQLT